MAAPDTIASLEGLENAVRDSVPAGEVWAITGLPKQGKVTVYINPAGTAGVFTSSSGRAALVAGTHEAMAHGSNPISAAERMLIDCAGLDAILISATTSAALFEVAA